MTIRNLVSKFTRLHTPAPLTVETYAFDWLAQRSREGLKSERDYRSMLDRHIVPALGDRALAEVRPSDIREFVRGLREKGLANMTVLNVYGLVRNLYAHAEADELVIRSPCLLRKIDLPKKTHQQADFRKLAIFERSEVQRIIDTESIDRRWRVLYATAFLTGARVGELLALRWSRLDLDVKPLGRIIIAESYSSKRDEIGSTKTESVREVPVHPRLVPFLAWWRDEGFATHVRRPPAPEDLVFPRRLPGGKLLPQRNTVVLRRFHRHLDELELRRRRFHDTRRTFVSLACTSAGVDRDVVRRITHQRPGDVHSGYLEVGWAVSCREVGKLEV